VADARRVLEEALRETPNAPGAKVIRGLLEELESQQK